MSTERLSVVKDTLLVVDDAELNRLLLRKTFENEFIVKEAANGLEALDILSDDKGITVVILDIVMPELDGFGVLDAMHADPYLSLIPVVVVTSSDDDASQIRALNLGAIDIISKPFSAQVITARVRNVVNRRRMEELSRENALMKLRVEQQAQFVRLIEFDSLTGTFNKERFYRAIQELLDDNPLKRFCLVRFDLDYFKVYNDAFGMKAGDALLRALGKKMHDLAGDLTAYGHIEADHFALCMPADEVDVEGLYYSLRSWLENYDPGYKLTPSMGVYVIDDTTLEPNAICDRALLALRSIKGNSVMHVGYFDEHLHAEMVAEQELLADLDEAFKNKDFVVYYQPQYDYDTNRIVGAEALVRWHHPENGLIFPGAFIDVLERNGEVTRLDQYVWESCCEQLRSWLDRFPWFEDSGFSLSFNVSRVDLLRDDICDTILNLTAKYRIPHKLLGIEITESSDMVTSKRLLEVIQRMQDNGFKVEMDDFGSGYSSLNTLKDTPVDVLKLDMLFLTKSASANEYKSNIIISAVVAMAKKLNLTIVAEGVETKENADFLQSIGCDIMQGYYFSKPVPLDDFERKLEESLGS